MPAFNRHVPCTNKCDLNLHILCTNAMTTSTNHTSIYEYYNTLSKLSFLINFCQEKDYFKCKHSIAKQKMQRCIT